METRENTILLTYISSYKMYFRKDNIQGVGTSSSCTCHYNQIMCRGSPSQYM